MSGRGTGLSGTGDPKVVALSVFDDGSGPALYAGGRFTTADDQAATCVARWDGESWSPLGTGLSIDSAGTVVNALTVFDDGLGAGPALYAGGAFTGAGGVGAEHLARWNGQAWSPLGTGLSGSVGALSGFDDASGVGPSLYAGGSFGPGADSHLARWGCPAIDTVPGCFGNPATLASLSGAAALGGTFAVSLSASQFATGLGVLFFGLDGTDAAGCGLFVPGWGELLLALAPQPKQVAAGPLSAGAVGFSLPVPNDPGLVGVEIALHGVAAGVFDPGFPLEFSNALRVTITQ